jgi:Sec-independent protein secretion pathway component TatC
MNPYLRAGGRFVAILLFTAGVLFTIGACLAFLDWIPFVMSSGINSWWAARADLRFGLFCLVLASLCFWKCARLVREEKRGVQI